jgi:hypothetical protein
MLRVPASFGFCALTHIITTDLEAQPPSQKNEGLKREHLLPGCNTIRVCAQLD